MPRRGATDKLEFFFKLNKGEKMFGLGMPELIIILVIIVIIFGAGKLPEIGSGIGKGIRNFKDATSKEDEKNKVIDEDNNKS